MVLVQLVSVLLIGAKTCGTADTYPYHRLQASRLSTRLLLPCRRGSVATEHIPGPDNSALHLSGNARTPAMPRIPLSLSQGTPGSTPQRMASVHHGQQQRLLSPARFTSAFARPPAPRSQSPLRRLAQRSAEFTASQPLSALPSTQKELQVCSLQSTVRDTTAQTNTAPHPWHTLKLSTYPA